VVDAALTVVGLKSTRVRMNLTVVKKILTVVRLSLTVVDRASTLVRLDLEDGREGAEGTAGEGSPAG
jgi:hypothetical protein